MARPHPGEYRSHDDDCRCVEGALFCNRDGRCWSCCGAAKEDSECTAPEMHPTNPSHPIFSQTISGFLRARAEFKTNEEIAELYGQWRTGQN